jgi:hypothetical protein
LIPKSLSASALSTAELCLARYWAENSIYGRSISGGAAGVGSSVHYGLEHYVKAAYIEKKIEPTLSNLLTYYQMGYMTVFNTAELEGPEYEDGLELTRKWHKRTEINGEVISCEKKDNFAVPFPDKSTVPLNYIFDRLDRTGPSSYTVVDYKTQRWALSPTDLDAKIQARIYGLAVQIEYPDAEEIWVKFDLLRHDEVGIRFTREDNKRTWAWLKRAAARIYEFEYDPAESRKFETLNPDCKWCVRKTECETVGNNVTAGGIFSITDISEAVNRRANLKYQMDAAKAAIDELDKMFMKEAQTLDQLEFRSDTAKLNIGISSRRAVDADRVEHVVGSEIFRKYGSTSISMSDIDKLLKGDEISPEQKNELKSLIYRKVGEPSVKVSRVSPFDE